jgi:anti-sigma factor RsiW
VKNERAVQLAAYFDGELDEGAAREVEASLQNDAAGRAFLEGLQAQRTDLSKMQAATESEDAEAAWAALESQLEEQTQPSSWLLRFPFLSGALAAAAVLVLTATIILQLPLQTPTEVDDPTLTARVEYIETDIEDATPVVFLDEPSGWTVVWVIN